MNAKEEFLEETEGLTVLAAIIQWNQDFNNGKYFFNGSAILKKGYSESDYNLFLDKLDFEYDNGYGDQKLFGSIWCKDGVWLDRGEYDGAEWWDKHQYPEIPIELL